MTCYASRSDGLRRLDPDVVVPVDGASSPVFGELARATRLLMATYLDAEGVAVQANAECHKLPEAWRN
eukprot:7907311-Lingulodinium_polyedra.AAC.1